MRGRGRGRRRTDGGSLYFIEVWLPEPYFDTHPRKHWLYVLCSVSWSDSLGPHGLESTRLLHGIFQAGIWSELPLPTPDILLIQELNPCLSHWQADSITTELPEKPRHPLAWHIRLFLHWSPPINSHWRNSSSSSSNPLLLKPSFTLSTILDRASQSHLCATIATRDPSS